MTCYDGHSVWVNSKALALAGITKDTPNPTNGIDREGSAHGRADGRPEGSGRARSSARILPSDRRRTAARRYGRGSAHAQRFGVTSVQNAGGPPKTSGSSTRRGRRAICTSRIYLAFSVTRGLTEADARPLRGGRGSSFADDPMLKTGAVKMLADGVIETGPRRCWSRTRTARGGLAELTPPR